MTKDELRINLLAGKTMDELFQYSNGQECLIYKANAFATGPAIIYIPDISLNEIPMDSPLESEEKINDVISICYTGDDFVDECNGDVKFANRLFNYCDWQHPSSALPEIELDENDGDAQQTVKITIYQAPYASLLEHGLLPKMHNPTKPYEGVVPAEYYLPVFSGEIGYTGHLADTDDQETHKQMILEHVFSIFNNNHPAGYCGRSLSVGDVVHLMDRYYLCSVLGFTPITFAPEKRQSAPQKSSAIELVLPNDVRLRATAYPEQEYPCINVDMLDTNGTPTRLCFVEYNPEKESGQELCIGAYCASDDDTVYYSSYFAKDGASD